MDLSSQSSSRAPGLLGLKGLGSREWDLRFEVPSPALLRASPNPTQNAHDPLKCYLDKSPVMRQNKPSPGKPRS